MERGNIRRTFFRPNTTEKLSKLIPGPKPKDISLFSKLVSKPLLTFTADYNVAS
jgi:hypothetical protein